MMKKNLLAASLALALGSLSGAATADWKVNDQGIGHYNLVPYYTVQEGSNTLINIVNTDTTNGKVVKVRFRAAEWSDDALDFQVFLSPGDVWTAAVGVEGGVPKLVSSDKSCTLPADLGAGKAFPTTRVEGRDAAKLFEGYVEIFAMADVPKLSQSVTAAGVYGNATAANPLYTAIKHVDGVAPCTATVVGADLKANNTLQTTLADINGGGGTTALTAEQVKDAANQVTWMKPSTGGLMTNVTIIKVDSSRAFAIPATAITSTNYGTDVNRVQYFRQSDTVLGLTDATARLLTADRLFYSAGVHTDAASLKTQLDATTAEKRGANYPAYEFDLPDLSTPFATGSNARAHRDTLANLLNTHSKAAVEYLIEPGLKATTDVVFSQPMRRYFYDYTPVTSGTSFNRTINGSQETTKTFRVAGQDNSVYQGITLANLLPMTQSSFFDREERTGTSGIVVSPSEPGDPVALKGEVSVISVKNGAVPTGSLGAKLTANNWEFAEAYTSGWASLSLAAATSFTAAGGAKTDPAPFGGVGSANLPVIGFSAINIFNAAAGAAGTNYGMINPLRKF